MITILQTIPDFALLTEPSKIIFTTSKASVILTLNFGEETIISETYVPDSSGKITLREMNVLLEPYLSTNLVETFTLTIKDSDETKTQTFTVLYSAADIPTETATSFTTNHFLTMIQDCKKVMIGWTEYLHFYLNGTVEVTAECFYMTATASFETVTKTVASLTATGQVVSVEISPELFENSDLGRLYAYIITAGSRTMEYKVQPLSDCAPCLLFTNSFGCQETLYCKGTHSLEPEYERGSSYIEGLFKNYNVEENKIFKANTGVLTTAMSNWADDVFRSKEIYLLNGTTVGKEITITEAKAIRSNDPDHLPSFEFEYRYAQRNHNVLQLGRAGRVFDNTFDNTFE